MTKNWKQKGAPSTNIWKELREQTKNITRIIYFIQTKLPTHLQKQQKGCSDTKNTVKHNLQTLPVGYEAITRPIRTAEAKTTRCSTCFINHLALITQITTDWMLCNMNIQHPHMQACKKSTSHKSSSIRSSECVEARWDEWPCYVK